MLTLEFSLNESFEKADKFFDEFFEVEGDFWPIPDNNLVTSVGVLNFGLLFGLTGDLLGWRPAGDLLNLRFEDFEIHGSIFI